MLVKKIVLLLLCLHFAAIVNAQVVNVKEQVYLAFFNDRVLKYDSTYNKQIEDVFITPLDKKVRGLEFDVTYLRDYLSGNITRNNYYREHVQPKGGDTLSYLSYPWGLDRLLRKDKQAGHMLLKLDSAMRRPQQVVPAFARRDKRFMEIKNTNKIFRKGWECFYQQHYHSYGIMEVSDIVFSDDNQRSSFYCQYYRDGLNGWGGVIYMRLTPDGWQQEWSLQFWAS